MSNPFKIILITIAIVIVLICKIIDICVFLKHRNKEKRSDF